MANNISVVDELKKRIAEQKKQCLMNPEDEHIILLGSKKLPSDDEPISFSDDEFVSDMMLSDLQIFEGGNLYRKLGITGAP